MTPQSRRSALDETAAHRVWDVIVEKAGARESDREDGVRYLTTASDFAHEFRFIGLLGFGGKVRFSDEHGAWIDCYREDRDEVKDAILSHVNERLALIVPTRAELYRRAAAL